LRRDIEFNATDQEMPLTRRSIHRPVIALAGLLVVLSAQARAEDSNRETIIQGVRDDVRRKIQEGSEKPAETNPEQLASGSKQQQPASPASERSSPKQEPER
jgi:hypothetical protein